MLGIVVGLGSGTLERASAETWTNLNGTASIEATLVGLWGNTVILQKTDGSRIRVEMDSLRADSRIQANQLAEALADQREERIAALKQQSESGGAPAPDPLPQPAPAAPYTAPEADVSATEFLAQVSASLTAGHLRVLYDALPPSYRTQARELIQAAAQKLSEQTWKSLVATPRQLGELIVTRQNWLFSSPRFANFPPEQQPQIKEFLLGIGHVLRHGLQAETVNLERLRDEEFDRLLTQWDQAVAPYVADAINNSELDFAALTKVISEAEDEAVVAIGLGDAAVEQTYRRIEGYWVSEAFAESWKERVAEYQQQIDDAAAGELMASQAQLLSTGATLLNPLAEARSADQFHAAFDRLLNPLKNVLPPGLLTGDGDAAGSPSATARPSAAARASAAKPGQADSGAQGGQSVQERMRAQLQQATGGGAPRDDN